MTSRARDIPADDRLAVEVRPLPTVTVVVVGEGVADSSPHDGVIAFVGAHCVVGPHWAGFVARSFQLDPDLAALTGPISRPGPLGAVVDGARRLLVSVLLARPPLSSTNWAVRASDWRSVSALVARDSPELGFGIAAAIHLGPERRIRFDPLMRAASTRRGGDGWHGVAALLAEANPLRRWRRRLAFVAHRRRQRSGGARPRERSRLVRAWRLWASRRPVTFTEKVRYKMLRDHRPLITTFADKAAVRNYVADRIGEGYLPVAYAISPDPRILLDTDLPDEFVLKPTHGSGAAFVVSHRASPATRLPTEDASWVYRHVLPAHADRAAMARLGARWLEQLFGQGPNREWAYGGVPRQLILEELLVGPDGGIPDDFKFFVFHGVCRYIQVDDGRFDRRTQDFYLPDWSHLPLSGGPPWADPPHEPPSGLAQMIRIAETLGADTDFVRVDLYHLDGRIVFGELTSYPAGGYSPFEPAGFDAEFGSHWTVPKKY
ncbi:ATP-grasp fold amidoligase family protein [Conyzicola sp.]|uniref:ATP-grasp fold amidoligase family protein n=1 Tax=Conyzicola sp. TaxID=1969404 RepID=UPI003988E221